MENKRYSTIDDLYEEIVNDIGLSPHKILVLRNVNKDCKKVLLCTVRNVFEAFYREADNLNCDIVTLVITADFKREKFAAIRWLEEMGCKYVKEFKDEKGKKQIG